MTPEPIAPNEPHLCPISSDVRSLIATIPAWWDAEDAFTVRRNLILNDIQRDDRDAIAYPHFAAEYAAQVERWRGQAT